MHSPNGILGDILPELQTDYWIIPGGQFHQIGRWPAPNSLRAQARFRNMLGQHENPLATRYLVNVKGFNIGDPVDEPTLDTWAWFDLVDGTDNDFQGETEESPFTLRCEFQILHENSLPALGVPGIRLIAVWFSDSGSFSTAWEFKDEGGVGFIPRINTVENPGDDRQSIDSGFGFTSRSCEVFAMSECYDFPLHPELDPGFAAFNGVDAYISLTQDTPNFNAPFVVQADVRLHDVTSFWPIFGKEGTGGFFGMDEDDLIFIILRLDTDWVPVLDTWFNWRLEFEQETQLGYKLFIDDIEVMSRTTNRVFAQLNNLGVYRHNSSPTIWANMDLKNLKVLMGEPPSIDVALDMPLIVNALDSGPLENHGTTFNMDLPSS